jgi:hypothetical protein
VCIEQLTSALYLEKAPDVQLYRSVMDQLGVHAEPPEGSAKFLASLISDL